MARRSGLHLMAGCLMPLFSDDRTCELLPILLCDKTYWPFPVELSDLVSCSEWCIIVQIKKENQRKHIPEIIWAMKGWALGTFISQLPMLYLLLSYFARLVLVDVAKPSNQKWFISRFTSAGCKTTYDAVKNMPSHITASPKYIKPFTIQQTWRNF